MSQKRLLCTTMALFFLGSIAARAQTFYASNATSDYYVYFTWSEAWNACVMWPWSEYIFKYNKNDADYFYRQDYPAVASSGVTQPAYNGSDVRYELGPGRSNSFHVFYRHAGWGCDYSGEVYITGTTAAIRPPRNLTATMDNFDDRVVLRWDSSTTHVPSNKYVYRIYRNSALVTSVSSATRTWTDVSAARGVTYTYQVETYAADWNNASARVSAQGRVFDLNVRTEALASGVRITWERELSSDMNFQRYTIERKDGANPPEFLININSPTATSWTDPNTGGVPWPGYEYVYIVTPDNGGSTVYRPDSAVGKRLCDGSISGYVRAPQGGGVQGVEVTVTRLESVPQGALNPTSYSATTDANGFYDVKGIYYHTDAQFSVVPSMPGHGFRPGSENRRLTLASHTMTNVDFTDTSSFTVRCKVRQVFAGRIAPVKGVDVQINSISRGYVTGSDGAVATTVSPIGQHLLSVRKPRHGFIPADTTVNVLGDIDSLIFIDTTTSVFSGTMSGPCDIYIGTAQLQIYDSAATIDTLITTTESGTFSVRLPARDYSVRMTGFTPSTGSGVTADSVLAYFDSPVAVSLDTSNTTHAFIYRRAPQIHLSGLPAAACGGTYSGIPVFEQAKAETLVIEVRENFGAATCYVDSGFAIVTHTLDGGTAVTDTLELQNGVARYPIMAGVPDIIAPHLYNLSITAVVGNVGDFYATPVLVTGHRPRSQTYTTVSPSIPFTILRDPPGDGSSSNLSENSEFTAAMKISAKAEGSLNAWVQAKVGAEFEAGQFIFTASKVWGQLKHSFTVGASLASSTELSVKVANSTSFSTSGSPDITGAPGDVFVGGALNLVYALTDVVTFDTTTCAVVKTTELVMAPSGFNTTFMYTEDHIRSVLLPQLAQICSLYETTNTDSATIYRSQIALWNKMLDYNDSLKANATLVENRSFSAGVPYTSSTAITTSAATSLDFTTYIEYSIAAEAGIEIGGSGVSGGVEAKFKVELGASTTISQNSTRTTGYTLSDDDAGDYFSVDIKHDPVYATPVFTAVAGRSSCPWEAGTQPRDGVRLSADTVTRSGVSSTNAAVFPLKLANLSQSGEQRTYNLTFDQTSNPYGAIVTVGGSPVVGGVPTPFTVPADSFVVATVTVRKGPSAFEYRNLMFTMESPCDGAISSRLGLNVTFCDTCNTANSAPNITTTALDPAVAGQPYAFSMEATDPDGDTLMWYLLTAPDSLRINVLTGAFSWTPTIADTGTDSVVVRVTDGAKSDTVRLVVAVYRDAVSAKKPARAFPERLGFTIAVAPSTRTATLTVAVPLAETARLALTLYTIQGKRLQTWTIQGAGYHRVVWTANNRAPIMYVARLSGSRTVVQKKVVMLR